MPSSETISVVALAISLGSMGLSAYVALRDRGHLRTRSTFYRANRGYLPGMEVEAVNVGRRPVILTRLIWLYGKESWSFSHIGDVNTGLRLGENERFSERIDDGHHMLFYEEPFISSSLTRKVTDLCFEDTLGRRYHIKGAKKHLVRFFKQSRISRPTTTE
jgi:hypothetical protein